MHPNTALPPRRDLPLLWRVIASTVFSFLLASCGGGGGGDGGSGGGDQTLSLSSNTVTVSASTIDPTPVAQVSVSIGNATIGFTYYVAATTTNSGIANVGVGSGSTPFQATGSVGINFKSPASLGVGTYSDTVTIRGCYDQGCSQLMKNSPQSVTVKYTVTNPVPTVTGLSPSSSSAGASAFSLTVYGTEFASNSVVNWNGTARPTTYVSGTQLTVQVAAGDLATSGSVPVTVSTPGGATSGGMTFTINPAVLTSLTPTFAAAGGPAFTLDVLGSGFASSSVVQWNGSARTTTFISATELKAQVTAGDIAAVGSASVTVLTPTATGGPTGSIPVSIGTLPTWPASAHAVAYGLNPAHTGAVTFSSVTFPAASTWTVDLGGTVSYPLIANGRVFVTKIGSDGNSSLYALDQTTGGTIWGPLPIPGFTAPAYDNGVVFVSSGVSTSGGPGGFIAVGSIRAYDAATGALLWNTPMSGFDYLSTSAPTATNGYVYVTGGATDSSNNGTFALNASTGAVSWLTRGPSAGNSAPAVSASGVYVDFVCSVYSYNPTTGQQLWTALPRCSSGGSMGSAPVIAGNTVFMPNPLGGGYSGAILDATTGASVGTYSATVQPIVDSLTAYLVQPGQSAGSTGNLQAITLGSNTPKWTFTGESAVCSAITVGQYVIAEGCSGKLYGVTAATGQQVWVTNPGHSSSWNFTSQLPLPNMAAGDGVLVIPDGTKLTTYTLSMIP